MVLGADAIIVMAFSGAHDEHVSLSRLAHLSAECEKIGMVLIAESIPGGWGQDLSEPGSLDGHQCRQGRPNRN